eukprot:15365175-Ditylum_brightwellii.AAC.2
MFTKQGLLLVGWAYATRRAAQLGPDHVVAHQVALSLWLVFALIMDGVAVAAQVIMSTTWSLFVRSRDDDEVLNQEGEKKEGVMQDALEEKNDSSSSPSRCEFGRLGWQAVLKRFGVVVLLFYFWGGGSNRNGLNGKGGDKSKKI